MEIISSCTQDVLKKAAKSLKDGNLVVFPTETVYGLGADAMNEKAVSRIFSAKGRPIDHPLIVHISSLDQVDKWAVNVPSYALSLAQKYWPGPLTLVLPRSTLANNFVTGGQNTIALRVPKNKIAISLLKNFEKIGGIGLAAPSANRFGQLSPTSCRAVVSQLGNHLMKEDLILDGGQCEVGIESTILDCTQNYPTLLRPGVITSQMIQKHLEIQNIRQNQFSKIRISGNFERHYSPKAKVLLDRNPVPGQGFIAMSEINTPSGVIRLASPKSNQEFARVLYSSLYLADELGIKSVVISQPTGDDIAVAICDRLSKASFQEINMD
jgi:L-threonylcarbamoyladenylate synthase